MFEIPEYVQKVLNRLEQNGFEACIVGGCVRDFLLGKTPNDYDVTTNALPEQIKECFSDISNIDYGQKHGTVAVVSDGNIVEIPHTELMEAMLTTVIRIRCHLHQN